MYYDDPDYDNEYDNIHYHEHTEETQEFLTWDQILVLAEASMYAQKPYYCEYKFEKHFGFKRNVVCNKEATWWLNCTHLDNQTTLCDRHKKKIEKALQQKTILVKTTLLFNGCNHKIDVTGFNPVPYHYNS